MKMYHRVQQIRMGVAGLACAPRYYQPTGFNDRKYFGIASYGFHGHKGRRFRRIEECGHLLLVIDDPEFLGGIQDGIDKVRGCLCEDDKGGQGHGSECCQNQ